MVPAVFVFPEVAYMDVTSNTNKEGRYLFLMMVKDSNEETFVGNVTIMPTSTNSSSPTKTRKPRQCYPQQPSHVFLKIDRSSSVSCMGTLVCHAYDWR